MVVAYLSMSGLTAGFVHNRYPTNGPDHLAAGILWPIALPTVIGLEFADWLNKRGRR